MGENFQLWISHHLSECIRRHGAETFPDECCGAMIGSIAEDSKVVRMAVPLENAFEGIRSARYELRPQDLLAADKAARERQMDLIGIYHSHPDCDAYFSRTDLQNSCPWAGIIHIPTIRPGRASLTASMPGRGTAILL